MGGFARCSRGVAEVRWCVAGEEPRRALREPERRKGRVVRLSWDGRFRPSGSVPEQISKSLQMQGALYISLLLPKSGSLDSTLNIVKHRGFSYFALISKINF